MSSTICLNMIVKNESAIIVETLDNILKNIPIDCWVISDTGSTDNTPQTIKDYFHKKGIPGELCHHQWQDFGRNRQMALEAAQGKSDYLFFFDADDRFEGKPIIPKKLKDDAYTFVFTNASRRGKKFFRRLIVKNDGSWQWEGVLHEVIEHKNKWSQTLIEGDYQVLSGRFGSNRRSLLDDAKMLVQGYKETDNLSLKMKYAFFCAQTYHEAKKFTEAIKWNKIHIDYCNLFDEDARYSMIRLGKMYNQTQQIEKARDTWLKAYNYHPHNAEAMVILSEHYLRHQLFQLAYDFAKESVNQPIPEIDQVVTFEKNVYIYGTWNALMLSAMHLKKYEDAYRAVKQLLKLDDFSATFNNSCLEVLILLKDQLQSDPEKSAIIKQTQAIHKTNKKTKDLQEKLLNI